ncbi:MAG: hypothetical protein J7M14_02660, partial [Planctomycetes bacterium]|nr:hypothetical protein [Planctomycetota bacterium]
MRFTVKLSSHFTRRYRLGALVLALLVGAVLGYWVLTGDERVRATVENKLRDLLGQQVRLARAKFRLFGPLELGEL